MSSAYYPPISAPISHLKSSISESDYQRAKHELDVRESILRNERDEIARQLAKSLKDSAILTNEINNLKREHGESLLNKHEAKQQLIYLKREFELLKKRFAEESAVQLTSLKRERDEFELKLKETAKVVEILKKQCRNLSNENGELTAAVEEKVKGLKEQVSKAEEEKREARRREKEAEEKCAKLREELKTLKQCRKEELERSDEKHRKAEGKLEVVMIAATDRYKELERRVMDLERNVATLTHFSASGPQAHGISEAEEQQENSGSDDINGVLTGHPSVCETAIQESILCVNKSAPAPRPVFEISDSDDENGEDLPQLKGVKRKLSFSEASNEGEASANSGTNKSKQLKGLADEYMNTSSLLTAPVGGVRTPRSVSDGKQNSVALKQCENKSGMESEGKDRDLCRSSVAHDCKEGIEEESGYSETWEYEADMLDALEKDAELCMKAICALYPQHTAQGRSNTGSTRSKYGGFINCAVRVVELAKFLVNGDPEGKLRRSVAEFEKIYPNGAVECRKIAFNNSALLFEIYKNKADPFFAA